MMTVLHLGILKVYITEVLYNKAYGTFQSQSLLIKKIYTLLCLAGIIML